MCAVLEKLGIKRSLWDLSILSLPLCAPPPNFGSTLIWPKTIVWPQGPLNVGSVINSLILTHPCTELPTLVVSLLELVLLAY